ncbi:hypothetical protein [Kribbella sindirgiensis]|uniref:ARB-07466-like C-terminal domain-containing protein n=1 Tax=Kribbella sindirgiensis TaxID=1124744 RepID=A0A4R0IN10_9ACTN|nr:hypothetical protein [Kribbella sindirgiensis]TCC33714.1 hypothetical protein E0H50_17385 [Kribbella sindirgiensis]
MFVDRGAGGVLGSSAGKLLGLKALGAMAVVGLMSFVLIVPFGAGGDRFLASCPPGSGDSRVDDPPADAPVRARQVAFAKIIDSVAVARGLPGRATLVALMTALQESGLENIDYGDRDSVGLFQQRPSAGWGTVQQILDPSYAAEAFFGGPNPPSPPGLVDIDDWPSMSFTEAAQAVQVSAFPDAYARHERTARQIAAEAGIDLERAGDPYAGRSGPKPTVGPSQPTDIDNSCGAGGGLIEGRPINGVWPPQTASVTDPTGTGGLVTPRTAAWVAQARAALANPPMSCWDAHVWNPTSDHPKGKACDVFVGGDSRRSAPARAKGDRIANWAIQTAGTTGVHYLIWYGKIWSARTGQWTPYNGGGVYDPSDATGGHYDHVHVSLY